LPVRHPPFHIFEQTAESMRDWCTSHAMPPFRATQILEWVYIKGVVDPALMSSLSKGDRDLVAAEVAFLSGEVVSQQHASDGTQKLLIQWYGKGLRTEDSGLSGGQGPDSPLSVLSPQSSVLDPSRQTECVMIPAGDEWDDAEGRGRTPRRTACISSQIGCPVGCRFCASGLGGLDGNLSAGRIVEQVWRLGQLLREQGDAVGRITNVVFMGMGEPLANLANVMRAVRIIATLPPAGLGISARKITISTVGLPKAIERLADELDLPVTLALSLHAPNDELRRRLIPWAEYTTIDDLLASCRKWFDKTGREITLEYILLRHVNDRPEHARELAKVARTLRANVNLIRYNEVAGIEFERPSTEDVREFQRILREAGVNTHIRASRGRDIAAACGQLRHEQSQSLR
jgi:23S rRNA (adenine2503-C2)-methyltransferase